MKPNIAQERFGERVRSNHKRCGGPATVCRISLCCCLLCCLLPGLGLLAFTYMTYGNFESVQAKVVGQEFCGYYRRHLKGTSKQRLFEPSVPSHQRRMKKTGGTSSSSSRKNNNYKMTYNFETLEGENITTTTDYCVPARRPINSTEWLLYDPDDPYTVVHENRPSGYLVFGISLTVAGGLLMCAACVIYKVFMSIFGDLMMAPSDNNNTGMPDPTEHSQSGASGSMFAAAGLGAALSQMMSPNTTNNNNNNTASNANGSAPNSTPTPDTSTPTYNNSNTTTYENTTTNNNDYSYGNTSNAYTSNNNSTFGDGGDSINNTGYNSNNNTVGSGMPDVPTALTTPASVNMTGYRPP